MIVEAISNFCGMVKNAFAFFTQKDAQKNAAPVQAAKQAQEQTNLQDKIETDVATKNIDEVRKEIAE